MNHEPAPNDPTPTDGTLDDEQAQRLVALAMDLARAGETAQLAEFLDHGFVLDQTDVAGNTLLMLAAYSGQAETVAMLLARGANPDLLNGREQSPVAGALFKGEDEVVALLIAAGADLDAGTPTARVAAAMFGREHLLS
ncbi:ankyrin repeat domain-containing protein [Arthrobacter glacialis]